MAKNISGTNTGGLKLGIHSGEGLNLLPGHPGDPLDIIKGKGLYMLPELIKADSQLPYKVFVVKLFLDYDLYQSHRQTPA